MIDKAGKSVSPNWWLEAKEHLRVRDTILAGLIDTYSQNEGLKINPDLFKVLCFSIISQQISTKAADAIQTRLVEQVGIHPKKILQSSDEILKKIGLGTQKAQYIKNCAHFMTSYRKPQEFEHLAEQLIAIKGVGSWTVEMVALFHWGKSDILPLKDLGLLRAFAKLYMGLKLEKQHHKKVVKAIEKHQSQWHPYQTMVTWYLWRYSDPAPVSF